MLKDRLKIAQFSSEFAKLKKLSPTKVYVSEIPMFLKQQKSLVITTRLLLNSFKKMNNKAEIGHLQCPT